jgi:hypothetical protein
MRTIIGLGLSASTLLVLACSSVATRTDTNPALAPAIAGWRTYAWMPPPEVGDQRIDNDIVRTRVMNAVDHGLAARGFRLDEEHPDFRITWYASIETKLHTDPYGDYYDYGLYGSGHEYNEGSFVLDFIDAARNQLAWRGIAEGRLSSKQNAMPKESQVNDAVKEVLEEFSEDVPLRTASQR